jgi:MFS family permease
MNIKIRNTLTEIIAVAIAIAWMYSKLNAAANMSIASITQVLVQGIGISILFAIVIAIVSAIITKSKEKNVIDERDNMIEFYALRLSNVIFGISLLIILALLGWFNLPINFGIIAITLSVFLASICSTFLKIYLYK